jgi:hypothetical protein
MKSKTNSRLMVITTIASLMINLSCKEIGTHKGPYDIVDQQNDKVGILFEQDIAKEKATIERGIFYPGLKPSCTARIDEYFKTIKYIESYASKGTESTNKFNHLEVKITFNDGKIVTGLYTGQRVIQAYRMGPQLLIKMELANGKVVKTYTNGVERKISPEDITLYKIKDAVLYYDRHINSSAYYYPAKTKKDIEKEWDKIK